VRLYVNIDHVATVRQARRTDQPDPVAAALEAEAAGADGITFHLREDRRHVQDHDVRAIVAQVRTVANFELAPRDEMVALAASLAPFQATLVPERREEVTTEGGLDLTRDEAALRRAIERLTAAGVRVSLFIDPEESSIDQAKALGVPAVELHTGRYSHGWRAGPGPLEDLRRAARHAAGTGLAVHAGHGLTLENVGPVARIPEIEELNIGHAIVARAISIGIGPATREMRQAISEARG
jgi:pyridoxine 5-phosphate synthase